MKLIQSSFLYLPLTLSCSLLLSACGGSNDNETTSELLYSSENALIINEIVASDADGGEDWIEFYATQDIDDISVYSIVDDNSEHSRQALPSVGLSAGDYLIVEAIDEEDISSVDGYYVTFKLGSDDALTLYENGTAIQILDWDEGEALEGDSYGIYEDVAQTLSPTKGAENALVSNDDSDSGDDSDSSESNDEQSDNNENSSNDSESSESTENQSDSSDDSSNDSESSESSENQSDSSDDSSNTDDSESSSEEEAVAAPSDTTINEDASLRINEIVAKAIDSGEDWIEFYVTGDSAVNLGDYTLADENLEIVSLPDVTLQPGEFYRVYATDEELDTEPTVALKFSASDQAHLYLGDDLVDSLSWKKGQALIGYSYGRYPDGSDATQTLTPSAGDNNLSAALAALLISEVMASDADGGSDWFELYNNSSVDIDLSQYSVIDESDDIDPISLPEMTLSAGSYVVIYADDEATSANAVSFKLGKEDELSLILENETVAYLDWDESDVSTGYSYGLNPDTLVDYELLNPTMGAANSIASAFDNTIVNSLYIDISTENWASILADPTAEEYHEASITLNDLTLDSVAIRTKGNSSLTAVANSNSDRYSFKIDINEYVDGQKFFGLKKFTLQNSYNDPSYMREKIAYQLFEEMGVPAPDNSYVNVYINNELFGLYLMVEAIDGEFIEDHFNNDNGDLYKPDGEGSTLEYDGSDISNYSEINLQNNEDTTDNGAFLNLVEEMDNGSSEVINVDLLLRYMAVSVSLSNLDSYHGTLAHNYYLYDDDGVFSLLPWDLNESFGTFNMDCDQVDLRELYIDEPTTEALSERPFVANVFANQTYLDTYHDYLWQLIEGSLQSTAFADRVNEIADLIREDVSNDPSAFYSAQEFEQNLTSSVDGFYGLTSFISYRVANMTAQLQGTIDSAGDGSGFCNSSSDDRPFR